MPEEPEVKVPKPHFSEPTPAPYESPVPNGPIPKGLARQTIRHIIDGRWLAVYKTPKLLTDRTHRWDQSDIFYPMRTMLFRMGYNVESLGEEEVRGKLYSYIKEYCEKLGIKRHEIGIFAADRAVVAYRGKLLSVSFENYKELAWLGCDVGCIEKEGTVEKWAPFTEIVGIALVHSQGFVSEYGVMLAQEAKKTGANVFVVTDFDSDGVKIAFHIEGITRIGIDFTTIDEINKQLKAELEDEEEEEDDEHQPEAPPANEEEDERLYKPDLLGLDPPQGELGILDINELVEKRGINDNWKSLEYLTKGLRRKSISNHKLVPILRTVQELRYIHYLQQTHTYKGKQITNLEFLKENRIELNTIMTEIGAKRFWNWLYAKIVETFPTRNYTRVIPVPPYEITLPALDKLNVIVNTTISECIKDEIPITRNKLRRFKGLLDIEAKMDEIDERFTDIVNEDEKIANLNTNLKRVVKSVFNIDVDEES